MAAARPVRWMPTYARRALVSAVIDRYRRPWRREEPAELDRTLAGDDRIDEHVTDREMLLTGLRRLPPRQRACVVLRYFDQLSVEETAEAMRCSPGTVKSQTSRGLEALRSLFEKHGRIDAAASMGEGKLR